MQNDWCSWRHMDAVVGPVLMAGSDNVLRQCGAGQVKCAMRIRQDSSSLGRGDLKGGMAHPFHCDRRRSSGGHTQELTLHDLQLVTEAEHAGREGEQQNQRHETAYA
jgi:hypothetical protein